jgi:hypothetical protein
MSTKDKTICFEDREGEDKTSEKRAAMKGFTKLLNEDVAIQEIKEKVDMDLITEGARWKIYAKGLEHRKNNNLLEAQVLLKPMNSIITEQIKLFYLVVKCLIMLNQWQEVEPWKTRYVLSPKNN